MSKVPLLNTEFRATPNNGEVGPGNDHEYSSIPHDGGSATGLNDQYWQFDPLLDPLSALDFSNFAQAGSADSAMGLTFF